MVKQQYLKAKWNTKLKLSNEKAMNKMYAKTYFWTASDKS